MWSLRLLIVSSTECHLVLDWYCMVLCGVSDDCDDMEISGAPGLVISTSASSLSPGSWEGWLQAGLICGWLGSPSQYEKTGSRDQLVWSLTVLQLTASWSRADSSPDITNHHLATWGVVEFSELARWAPLRWYLRFTSRLQSTFANKLDSVFHSCLSCSSEHSPHLPFPLYITIDLRKGCSLFVLLAACHAVGHLRITWLYVNTPISCSQNICCSTTYPHWMPQMLLHSRWNVFQKHWYQYQSCLIGLNPQLDYWGGNIIDPNP